MIQYFSGSGNNTSEMRDLMFSNGSRYNGIGPWMKEYFGGRVVKLSIDGGFTCPNRDGTLSDSGCFFCSASGSGDFTGDGRLSITEQMHSQAELISNKWNSSRFLAYFQNHTNTYASAAMLQRKYSEALSFPGCCGICIATRPDCLDDDIMQLLADLNSRTFLWVELGLQTSSDATAQYINRCYPTAVYDEAVERLINNNIRVVTHVIFGLPGESHDDMLATVKHACCSDIFGIKLHLLHIMRGTMLGKLYQKQQDLEHACGRCPDSVPEIIPMSRDDYINTIADAIEIIPPQITIHRLTGDAPHQSLIAPLWSLDKKSVLNGINAELKRRSSLQGSRLTCLKQHPHSS